MRCISSDNFEALETDFFKIAKFSKSESGDSYTVCMGDTLGGGTLSNALGVNERRLFC